MGMKWYDYLAIVLLTIGGLNLGFVGIFNFNIVSWLSGILGMGWLDKLIYILVGASAVDVIYSALTGRFK